MTRVEFRYLYFVASQVADERFIVGFLHWDGVKLRFAGASMDHLPPSSTTHNQIIERELRAIVERAKAIPAGAGKSLTDIFQVPEGRGSSFLWGTVNTGQTEDTEQHFEHLRAVSGLVSERETMQTKAKEAIISSLKHMSDVTKND